MYFLSSFVYAGCMIGGLVERRNQYREAGVPSFPEHFGSICPAGLDWEGTKAKEEMERWDKKPPAKRPQFEALGTANPWRPNWTPIISSSSIGSNEDEEMEINVKREPDDLGREPWLFMTPLSEHVSAVVDSPEPALMVLKLVNAFRTQRRLPPLADKLLDELYATALVHVKVEVEGRGSPGDMAILYALDDNERSSWLEARDKDRKYGRMDWLAGSGEEPKAELQKVSLRIALTMSKLTC
jgi:ribonuclease P/MRP protein subunit POP1